MHVAMQAIVCAAALCVRHLLVLSQDNVARDAENLLLALAELFDGVGQLGGFGLADGVVFVGQQAGSNAASAC